MIELVVYFAIFGTVVLALSIGTVGAIGVSLAHPRVIIYGYLLVFLIFSASTHGLLDATRVIYGRGSGQLVFPFVTWALWGIGFIALLLQALTRQPVPAMPMRPWFWAFGALLVGHIIAAKVAGASLRDTVAPLGFISLVNMGILVAALIRQFRTQTEVDQLVKFLLLVVTLRGLFGIGRLLFFGGDPANVYDNFHNIGVKVTFFDVADSLTACIALFIAAWRLYFPRAKQTQSDNWIFLFIVAIELVIIAFSYRRIAWSGLLIAGLLFIICLPARQRFTLLATAIPLGLSGLIALAIKRLSKEAKGQGFIESFFHEFSSKNSFRPASERELELHMAWDTITDNFLFGVGAWGRYEGRGISWQTGKDAYTFVHSGFLHIWLKTGLVGIVLFSGLLLSFVLWFLRARKSITPAMQPVFYAGAAGCLFMIPTFMVGTPAVEIRTTQLLALCMSLSLLAWAASQNAAAK